MTRGCSSERAGETRTLFGSLFGRYERAIYRYAVLMGGPDAGDDIVQETFLAVLRQRGQGRSASRALLLRVLIGIARRLLFETAMPRRGMALFNVSLDESREGESGTWEIETQLEHLTREEVAAAVRAAVQSLPEAYREVVVLCDLEEMDYAAAAALMECPIRNSSLAPASRPLSADEQAVGASACLAEPYRRNDDGEAGGIARSVGVCTCCSHGRRGVDGGVGQRREAAARGSAVDRADPAAPAPYAGRDLQGLRRQRASRLLRHSGAPHLHRRNRMCRRRRFETCRVTRKR